MDGVSAAASVVALIQISEEVACLCTKYLKAVKNAKTDIERLQKKLEGLKVVLEGACRLLASPNGASLQTSQSLRDGLRECDTQLKSVRTRMEDRLKDAKGKTMSRFGLRALKWPFESKDVDVIVRNLETYQDLVSKGLIIDQTACVLDGFERIDEKTWLEILEWISPMPYRKYHDSVKESRTPGTCEWLLEHEKFQEWRNTQSSAVLWLQGSPGAGKTFLTSKVIDHVQSQLESPAAQTPEGFAFFYCNRNEDDRRDPLVVLRSYVRQLSSTNDHKGQVRQGIRKLWLESRQKGSDLSMSICKEQLKESLSRFSRTTIVLDALDECEPDQRGQLVDILVASLSASNRPVKIFISSRPDGDIRYHFASLPNIEIRATSNRNDIEKFVKEEIVKHRRWSKMSPILREDIHQTILRHSDGMFQWVFLQIKELLGLQTEQAIRDRLGKLPTGLKSTYDEIYGNIADKNKHEQVLVDRAIKWVMTAIRPLRSAELLNAVRVGYAGDEISLSEKLDKDLLLDLCNNLLVLDSQRKVWRFSHLSVAEYFEKHHWSLVQAHCHSAIICIALVIEAHKKDGPPEIENMDNDEIDENDHEFEMTSYSLFKKLKLTHHFASNHIVLAYALEYWVAHTSTQEGREADPALARLLKRLLGSPEKSSAQYQAWYRIISRFSEINRDMEVAVQQLSEDLPLFAMCRFSFYTLLRDWWDDTLLDLTPINTNDEDLLTLAAVSGSMPICNLLFDRGLNIDTSRGGIYGNAFGAAVHQGRGEIVSLFIAKGADVNAPIRSGYHGTALIAACVSRNIETVKMLIAKGAIVNVSPESGVYGSALEAAIFGGSLETVQFLVNVGADVNIVHHVGDNGSPLVAAAAWTSMKDGLLKFLVERGAQVNMRFQRGYYGCALIAAAANRNLDMVKYLVQQGANVNEISGIGKYRNVLIAAAIRGELDMVKYLVQQGANVNEISGTGAYGSALIAAAAVGSVEIVELLIERGAIMNAEIATGKYGDPLVAAAAGHEWSNREEVIKLLVEKGAKVNTTVHTGKYGSALLAAASQERKSLVEFLIDQGADVNMPIERDDCGSALAALVTARKGDMVEFLIKNGADVNMELQFGPYSCALEAAYDGDTPGHEAIATLLVKHGASWQRLTPKKKIVEA